MQNSIKQNIIKEKIKDVSITNDNLNRLKICCLSKKGQIFTNLHLGVSCLTESIKELNKYFIKTTLIFENIDLNNEIILDIKIEYKGKASIEFGCYIIHNKLILIEEHCFFLTKINNHIKLLQPNEPHEIIFILPSEKIFNLSYIDFSFRTSDRIIKNSILLPNLISKHIEFIPIRKDELSKMIKKNFPNVRIFNFVPNTIFDENKLELYLPKIDENSFGGRFNLFEAIGFLKIKSKAGKYFVKLLLLNDDKKMEDELVDLFEFLLKS